MDRTTSQVLLDKVKAEREKQANTPEVAAAATSAKQLRGDALKDIGNVAMWSLGAGASLRGAQGLYNLLRRNMKPEPKPAIGAMPLPYRVEQDEKAAAAGDSYWGSPITDKNSVWFKNPGQLLGGLAAGYAGWKGVDALLDSRRRGGLEDELEDSRKKFRQALLSSYSKPYPAKQAEEVDPEMAKVAESLDRLFDAVQEKQATLGDVLGQAAGGYATYAIPAALLSGYATYSSGKSNQRRAILEKAMKQRKMQRAATRPAPLYAMPVAVEDDEEKETTTAA